MSKGTYEIKDTENCCGAGVIREDHQNLNDCELVIPAKTFRVGYMGHHIHNKCLECGKEWVKRL